MSQDKPLEDQCPFCNGFTYCYHCWECGGDLRKGHNEGCMLDPSRVQKSLDEVRGKLFKSIWGKT